MVKDLHRLVYTSARRSTCTDEDVSDIIKIANKENKEAGITGILVYSPNRFLQVLEGEKEVLDTLLKKISVDNRHGGLNIRFFEPVESRVFGGWYMASLALTSELNLGRDVSDQDREHIHNIFTGSPNVDWDEGIRVLRTFLKVV